MLLILPFVSIVQEKVNAFAVSSKDRFHTEILVERLHALRADFFLFAWHIQSCLSSVSVILTAIEGLSCLQNIFAFSEGVRVENSRTKSIQYYSRPVVFT